MAPFQELPPTSALSPLEAPHARPPRLPSFFTQKNPLCQTWGVFPGFVSLKENDPRGEMEKELAVARQNPACQGPAAK